MTQLSLREAAQEHILERMAEYIGQELYREDLAYTLTENENATGSFTCNAWSSREFIVYNWREAANFKGDWETEVGDQLPDAMFESEAFEVCFMIEAIRKILAESVVLDQAEEECEWANMVTITQDLIDELKIEFDRQVHRPVFYE